MGQASDKMAATDGHLSQVENVLVRVKEIAINSVNSALSQSDLAALADEIAELKNELLDTANAVVNGKYIFAGYQEDTKPFSVNANYDPTAYDSGDVTTWPYFYHGDHNPTQLEITPGETLETNLTGNEVFFGITNEIAATGYANPYQGETMTSGPLLPGPFADNITLSDGLTPPVLNHTILGTDILALPGETNYAGKIAGLFSAPGTGLTAKANAAVADLGSLSLIGFDSTEGDAYTLDITSDNELISVQLGPSGYDYTLDGLASALANTVPAPKNLTMTSGTLANGVNYDISSGSLVLTGPADGSEIILEERITDIGTLDASGGFSGISGGDRTVYGTFTIAPNSPTDVMITGASLGDVGLTTDTLNGSSGRIDLFTILTRTEEAIRAGNVDNIGGAGGSIQAQIENLEIAANQNRSQRSTLGARAQRVDSAMVHQEDAQIDLKQILSRYQDADMLQVFNDITQKETAFQAALNITGRVSQISILDYF
jgi:flagellin-like hook-associated protein FlgL